MKLSVIIPASNDGGTIAHVIGQARLVRFETEIIVVCHGSKDRTAEIAKTAGAAKVVISDVYLGYDIGRCVGAEHAGGDILLFLDADFVIPSELLAPFVSKIEQGWDVVLNEYAGVSQKQRVSGAKHLLNHMLGRPDLRGSSMTTVPHALSRRALQVIGIQKLCVPPVAHAAAVINGLSVTSGGSVKIVKVKRTQPSRKDNVGGLIVGDHAEAISYLISQRGARAGMTDFERRRDVLGGGGPR